MFNKFSALVLLIIFGIGVLSGCSWSPKGIGKKYLMIKEIEQNEGNAQKREIKFTRRSDGYPSEVEGLIKKYGEETRKGIEIEIVKIPGNAYDETLNMLFASGEGPDVFEISNQWIDSYISNGWLADISRFIDAALLKKFPGWALGQAERYNSEARLYTLSSSLVTVRLIYNRELFKSAGLNPDLPPRTLEELKEYAEKIRNTGKGYRSYGFAFPAGDAWNAFAQAMELTCLNSGIYYYDFNKGKYDLTVYEKWFEAITHMRRADSLFPGETTLKTSVALTQFAKGNIGMMYISSKELSELKNTLPKDMKYGIAMPPLYNEKASDKKLILSVSSYFGVNSQSRYTEDAAEVWKLLYTEKYMAGLYKNGIEIPVFERVLHDPEGKQGFLSFSDFLPAEEERPFENTLKGVKDWTRFDAYLRALKDAEGAAARLRAESDRLN